MIKVLKRLLEDGFSRRDYECVNIVICFEGWKTGGIEVVLKWLYVEVKSCVRLVRAILDFAQQEQLYVSQTTRPR